MSTFLERLQQEKTELDERKDKLGEFLQDDDKVNTIDPKQVTLLEEQLTVMKRYSEILQERLNLL